MPTQSRIDDSRGLLITRAFGHVVIDDLLTTMDEMVRDTGGFYRPHLFVIDENARVETLTPEMLLRLKDRIERWRQLYPFRRVRTALVVPNDGHVETARAWESIASEHPGVGSTVQLFRNEVAALSWLGV